MMESYTQKVSDYILDLPDREIAVIWEDIASMPQDTTASLWRRKLEEIARENSFSSRFALMRILYSRAHKVPFFHPAETDVPEFAAEYSFSIGQRQYCFRDISMEHAENLTVEEHLEYIACLKDIASLQSDNDPDVSEAVICRAWHNAASADAVAESQLPEDIAANPKLRKSTMAAISRENKAKYKECLTRSEALLLGHVLGFTVQEMQWFFLRVLDIADGFRYNLSGDLIEAYGFLTHASWQKVRSLYEKYEKRSAGIPKADSPDRNHRWTKNIADTLPGKVEVWTRYPETQDEQFMDWMLSHAPGLDTPSRSALRIYRNLAAFAYNLTMNIETAPSDPEFADCVRDVYQDPAENGSVQRLLYENGEISPDRCKEVADKLLLENKIQCESIHADNTKAWHILTQLNNGSLSAAGGIVNSSRSRVKDILSGKIQVEKGDMLYLFWFLSNRIWMFAGNLTDEIRSYRLMDFLELANDILEEAMLPPFYPPHIMERSMLLSIACGGKLENEDSSVVYEYMLNSLVASRNRKKKSDEE